ncbi:MAG TPA: hypothetical protein VMK65_09215 [Longimicrobiales bacterium]|nr:hypothetical protein [Longimicrobiales bacterium]
MIDDLKSAWRQAVENFWRELRTEEEGPAGQLATMQRQLATARGELRRLRGELARCARQRAAELEEAEACRRRAALAEGIGDQETVQVAVRFAARHQEKAEVLGRKLEAFEAERALLEREVAEMERALAEFRAAQGLPAAGPASTGVGAGAGSTDGPSAADYEALRRAERERAAEARLEELKRRMR